MRDRKWIAPEPLDVPENFVSAIGGNPLVAQTLFKRGLTDINEARAFIDPDRYTPAPPKEMPGVDNAIELLRDAILRKQKICVWGDFDVDGQTATAILVSVLTELDADVIYHIPHRATESHGINIQKLRDLIPEGIQVLLSCDTGISDHESINYAVQSGIKVIITDHHDLPEELPNAHAVVNPKLLPDSHPLKTLPGVGVAYKLSEGLYQSFGYPDDLIPNIDLVSLGIVADLARQIKDTRYLLQCGLEEIRRNPRIGLRAMLEVSGIEPENVTEEHIGFVLAPRLNALGRLTDAKMGTELLLTNNYEFAREQARKLEQLNEERKLITQQVLQAAISQLDVDPSLLSNPALILAHPTWPSGIIGIVANRLVEHYHKPTILISSPSGELARASARSIPGINITAAIAAQKKLLETYGGHAMAGGFSIRNELLPQFKQALFDTLQEDFKEAPIENALHIDGNLELSDLTIDLVSDLERLAPFGPGNPPLTLVSRALNLSSYVTVGRNDEHVIMTVEDRYGTTKQVMWWQGAGLPLPDRKFDLAFVARSSMYQDQKDVQLEFIDYRYSEETSIDLGSKSHQLTLVDYRSDENPKNRLEQILSEGNVEIWVESRLPNGIHGHNRSELKPADNLVIWTIPPGPKEFFQAIDTVQPSTIYLFGMDPAMDDPKSFLTRLAGLSKYVLINKEGAIHIEALAAASAQRVATVREGLIWLHAKGYFNIDQSEKDKINISPGSEEETPDNPENTQRLKSLLEESAAYRAYYCRTNKDSLLDRS